MPTTRSNQGQAPINSDAFDLTGDWAETVDSLQVIVTVANDAAGDTVASQRASAGFAVTDARPLFTYNQATKSIRVKDSSGWRDLAVPIKHAEFTSAAVNQSADSGVIFGIYTADSSKTFNNTFCSPGGTGAISILENGLYTITSSPQPPSSLGSNVHIFGTNSVQGTIMSANFNSYGNTNAIVTVTRYLTSGSTCQFGVTGNNTVNGITSRLIISKIQG